MAHGQLLLLLLLPPRADRVLPRGPRRGLLEGRLAAGCDGARQPQVPAKLWKPPRPAPSLAGDAP
jgi:hypothetical protein